MDEFMQTKFQLINILIYVICAVVRFSRNANDICEQMYFVGIVYYSKSSRVVDYASVIVVPSARP